MKAMLLAFCFTATIMLTIVCRIMASDIEGLTTRVNLLEARIHWQEAPPKAELPCRIDHLEGCTAGGTGNATSIGDSAK